MKYGFKERKVNNETHRSGWIEQILTFDDPHEVQSYLDELDSKEIQYSVIKREMSMLRIRKQYNKNTLLRKG